MNKNCMRCRDHVEFVLPEEIVNEIHDVVMFVGAGISTETKRAFPDTFYEGILEELELKKGNAFSFPEVMSLYVKKFGSRSPLIHKIRERFDYFKAWPELLSCATEFHEEIAAFPCVKNFVTTNWDDFLETVANVTPFVHNTDVPFWDTSSKRVLKIHGSINDLGSIIATEEDYKKCYRELNKNTIGSKLKLLLAQNIVIFIGYSFQDEDFQRIYKYISSKMGDFRRRAYVVTLDKSNEKNWAKYNLKPIYTEGSYFVHKLRKRFEKKGCLLPLESLSKVFALQELALKIHNKTSKKYKYAEFPEIIYCTSYQDGVLHAFQYLINKAKSGKSLCVEYLKNSINSYENLVQKYRLNWLEHSYLEGYLTGLYLFNGVMFPDVKLKCVPPFFYYNEIHNKKFIDEKDFEKSLKLTGVRSKKRQKARKFIERLNMDDSVIFHHIPRI